MYFFNFKMTHQILKQNNALFLYYLMYDCFKKCFVIQFVFQIFIHLQLLRSPYIKFPNPLSNIKKKYVTQLQQGCVFLLYFKWEMSGLVLDAKDFTKEGNTD